MSFANIHAGDYGWQAELTIQQDGVAVDISTYTTLEMLFTSPAGVTTAKTATFKTDGTDGKIVYTVESGLIDTAGYWTVQARVSKGGVLLTSDAIGFKAI